MTIPSLEDALFADFKATFEEVKVILKKLNTKEQVKAFKLIQDFIESDFTPELKREDEVAAQVEVVGGSQMLYRKIDENMKHNHIDWIFGKEYFNLYEWRRQFFRKKFPSESWCTDGSDDSHAFDTVPYQITTNFDKLIDLTIPQLQLPVEPIYLENDESKSNDAQMTFDKTYISFLQDDYVSFMNKEDETMELEDYLNDECNFPDNFKEAAYKLVSVYQNGPLPLEHLCMKVVLANDMSLDGTPRQLQEKVEHGLYTPEGKNPDCLSENGRILYGRYKAAYMKGMKKMLE